MSEDAHNLDGGKAELEYKEPTLEESLKGSLSYFEKGADRVRKALSFLDENPGLVEKVKEAGLNLSLSHFN